MAGSCISTFCWQDRVAYRAMMQQGREAGTARLQQIEEIRKTDSRAFALMVLEFRNKSLDWIWVWDWGCCWGTGEGVQSQCQFPSFERYDNMIWLRLSYSAYDIWQSNQTWVTWLNGLEFVSLHLLHWQLILGLLHSPFASHRSPTTILAQFQVLCWRCWRSRKATPPIRFRRFLQPSGERETDTVRRLSSSSAIHPSPARLFQYFDYCTAKC